jgi:glycosyltransferase involved in cell wall biosynthesis
VTGFFAGRAPELKAWQERAGLHVISSRFEEFSNTLAEAMTHGRPAVRFDCDTGPRGMTVVMSERRFRWGC